MPRGRRAKPAEIKALLGNPGKRRLALSNAGGKRGRAPAAHSPILPIEPPAFLTQESERAAFHDVMRSLPPNLVRQSDAVAFGRWAAWMTVWVTCKLALDGKKHWYTTSSDHSPEIHREHPLSKKMDKAEAHLITLEDRLCLNIVARNNVMHRLFNMPGAHPGGGLFGAEPSEDDKKPVAEDSVPLDTAPTDLDPRGFIGRAGKQHSTH
jgi:phage terminase small subunit